MKITEQHLIYKMYVDKPVYLSQLALQCLECADLLIKAGSTIDIKVTRDISEIIIDENTIAGNSIDAERREGSYE